MYTIESRIRFSEVSNTKEITLPAIINYFQDCSTFQSEELGLGFEFLEAHQKCWILSSWQIVIERYPKFGERVTISTWATGFQGLYGTRNFVMKDMAGNAVAYANSIWVFMDVKSGRPSKPKPADFEAYGTEDAFEMEYAPRKIARAKESETADTFPVRKYHIDTNDHVNNCQYVQMAMEVLPVQMIIHQVRVEYKKSAVYGDIILPKIAIEDTRTVIELCDLEENPYAIVELIGEEK